MVLLGQRKVGLLLYTHVWWVIYLKSSLRKFYGRYGDLIKHYEVSLSQMLHDILGHDHIQWHPQLIRHYTNLRTYNRTELYFNTDFDLITEFWKFTLQRVRLANRGRLLLRTPGPVPFGTCICSNVETILSWTCHVYGPFEFRTSLGTSILLHINTQTMRKKSCAPGSEKCLAIVISACAVSYIFIPGQWQETMVLPRQRNVGSILINMCGG